MATEWFYESETGAFGPISSEDLMQLAGRNGISLDTMVKKGHSGDWFPARKIKEIRHVLEESDSLNPLSVPFPAESNASQHQSSQSTSESQTNEISSAKSEKVLSNEIETSKQTSKKKRIIVVGSVCAVALILGFLAFWLANPLSEKNQVENSLSEKDQAEKELHDLLQNALKQAKSKGVLDFWDSSYLVEGYESQVQSTPLGTIPFIGRIVITLKRKKGKQTSLSPAGSLHFIVIYYTYQKDSWKAQWTNRGGVDLIQETWDLKRVTRTGYAEASEMAGSSYYSCFLPTNQR